MVIKPNAIASELPIKIETMEARELPVEGKDVREYCGIGTVGQVPRLQ